MFDKIERMKDYSALASWAIWERSSDGISFNKDSELNVNFEAHRDELQLGNTVFLGLNPAGKFVSEEAQNATRRVSDKNAWNNFHNKGKNNDYSLAEAIMNTKEKGSYMTDLFPFVGGSSREVEKFVKKIENRELIKRLIIEFDEEMSLLNLDKINLICLGITTLNLANEFLLYSPDIKIKNFYQTYFIPHHSTAGKNTVKKNAKKLNVVNYYPTVVQTFLDYYRPRF